MADAMQFEFPVSGSKEKSSDKIIGNIDVKKKNGFVNLISGGRFDELTSKFLGLKRVPAVGAAVNLSNYE